MLMKTTLPVLVAVFLNLQLYAQAEDFSATDFKKADSIANLYYGQSLEDLKSLSIKLTEPLNSDEEKFRSIYKWVCDNIENDYDFYVLNKKKRESGLTEEKLKEWNKKFSERVLRKLFHEKKTVCSGYAYLVMKLSTYAGLTSVIVNGYGRTVQANIGGTGIPNHSWNAVKLNDRWYLCDATWSSGAIDTSGKRFVKEFDEVYFLSEPSLFVRNHYPLDSTWVLFNNNQTLQTFLDGPLIYKSFYRYQIDKLFPETFDVEAKKGETVSFHFRKNGDKTINTMELRIDNSVIKTAQPPVITDDYYCMEHIFTSKGTYVVHIVFDSNYVWSYKIKVK